MSNSKKRNKRLYKGGYIDEDTYKYLDERLARRIARERAKKQDRVNELTLKVELLKNGLFFS